MSSFWLFYENSIMVEIRLKVRFILSNFAKIFQILYILEWKWFNWKEGLMEPKINFSNFASKIEKMPYCWYRCSIFIWDRILFKPRNIETEVFLLKLDAIELQICQWWKITNCLLIGYFKPINFCIQVVWPHIKFWAWRL